MISLSTLKPFPASVRSRKRLGRGIGSGKGKTSGRGHKGAGARAGSSSSARFEGGQMPLHMRLPKRGFRSKGKKAASVSWTIIQSAITQGKIDPSHPITLEILKKKALVRAKYGAFCILGKEGLEQSVTIHADRISQGARSLLEEKGGTFVSTRQKVEKLVKGERKKFQGKELKKEAKSQEAKTMSQDSSKKNVSLKDSD